MMPHTLQRQIRLLHACYTLATHHVYQGLGQENKRLSSVFYSLLHTFSLLLKNKKKNKIVNKYTYTPYRAVYVYQVYQASKNSPAPLIFMAKTLLHTCVAQRVPERVSTNPRLKIPVHTQWRCAS